MTNKSIDGEKAKETSGVNTNSEIENFTNGLKDKLAQRIHSLQKAQAYYDNSGYFSSAVICEERISELEGVLSTVDFLVSIYSNKTA